MRRPVGSVGIRVFVVALALALVGGPVRAGSAPEASFANFDKRARNGAHLNIVFLGGSLTWGHQATDPQLTSYRGLMAQKFEQAYPDAHFHFWDASIGGIGSQLAPFRMERDVFSRKPDLIFLEYAVNDGCYDTPVPDKLASYESLVRKIVQAHIPVELLLFGLKLDLPPHVPHRLLDLEHKKIGKAYNAPVADTIPALRQAVTDGKETPDDLWPMAPDDVHPGNAGYAIYADTGWETYQQAVWDKVVCHVPAKMLNADTYMTINRARLSTLGKLPAGWKVGLPDRDAISYNFVPSRWMDDITIASMAKDKGVQPEPIAFKVQAQNIILFGESSMDSGKYQYRIDGGDAKVADSHFLADHGNLRYYELLTTSLDPAKEHLLEIIPQLQPGQELKLESVCVAGGPATVKLTDAPPAPVAAAVPATSAAAK